MVDSRVTFQEFCDVCEKVQKSSKFAEKEKVFQSFIKKCRELSNDTTFNFYPFLRLLVPEYERERTPYGLKETSFSKLYVRVLCLKGADANNFLKYNKPSVNTRNINDFAEVAYSVLRKWCPKTSNLTVADVNSFLDQMAQKHADHQPREVEKELIKMIKTSTAVEQKWIIRIILKSMKLGVGNYRILKTFHPDAPDLYDVCSDLSKICSTLKDVTIRLHELEIEVFTPFRPMLSEQCNSDIFNKVIKGDKTFYVENKYDGERFQLHMKNGQFKYFSRNGYEYSNIYGENYNSNGLITPHLKKIFSKINSVILDGEMMGFNTKTNKFGSKGMNFDVKTLKQDNVHRPCFCVFDILYLNGQTLTNKPLSTRVGILDQLFEPIQGVILKSPRLEVKTKQNLMMELNKSVDRQEEGVCFKDPESIYKPNNRKGGWWKLKLEYFDGLMTELDIIILGGYYGEGRRKGLVSSFLLGVAASPENSGDMPKEFYTFAKVASGFSVEELNTLLNKLNQYWIPFEQNKNPENIIWKKEKPDFWIDPTKSCILQVKASELIRSTDFQTDYTLRFPRVEKVRYDKPWYNCMTLTELKELTKNNKAVEKLAGRYLTEGDVQVSPPKRIKKGSDNLSLYHLVNVEQKSTILAGKEFCVYTGNEQESKESIEIRIKECGGKVVQYPGPNTMCTLIGDVTPRAKSLLSTSKNDVVSLNWIIKVLNSSKFIELSPHVMLITSEKTKIQFSNKYDKYGDSYHKKTSKKDLKNIFENISKQGDILILMPWELNKFDLELKFTNPLGLFRSCFMFFDKTFSNSYLFLKQQEFLFYGGTICDQIQNFTTHIAVYQISENSTENSQQIEILKEQFEAIEERICEIKIVNVSWIEECIKNNRIILEDKYLCC